MARVGFEGFVTAGLAFIGMTMAAAAVEAAPQSLALVATDEPVELACVGDGCRAEFSAFCLQPDRVSPKPGTKYWLTDTDLVQVKGIAADGKRINLAAKDVLHFTALRGHTAVEISLAPGLKERMGLVAVAVTLSDNITLAPEAVQGDRNPITDSELAVVEESLRPLGGRLIDNDGEGMAAARVANRMVNLLPEYDNDAERSANQWGKLMARANEEGLSPMARRLAQNAYDLCRYYSDRVVPGDMRRCMQGQHDRLMKVLNSDYWKAIRTGS